MGKKTNGGKEFATLDNALKLKYNDHCSRLLEISQKNRSSIFPNKPLPLTDILKKFNAETGREIRQYGDEIKNEIVRIVTDTKSHQFSNVDKNIVLKIVDNYLKPELYIERFQGMLTAIEQQISRYGSKFNLEHYRIDMPKACCEVGASNLTRRIKEEISIELDIIIQKNNKDLVSKYVNRIRANKATALIIILVIIITTAVAFTDNVKKAISLIPILFPESVSTHSNIESALKENKTLKHRSSESSLLIPSHCKEEICLVFIDPNVSVEMDNLSWDLPKLKSWRAHPLQRTNGGLDGAFKLKVKVIDVPSHLIGTWPKLKECPIPERPKRCSEQGIESPIGPDGIFDCIVYLRMSNWGKHTFIFDLSGTEVKVDIDGATV